MKRNAVFLLSVVVFGTLFVILSSNYAVDHVPPARIPSGFETKVSLADGNLATGSPTKKNANEKLRQVSAAVSVKEIAPTRWTKPRSDGLKPATADKAMPLSEVVNGATQGDNSIDATLPKGAKASGNSQPLSLDELTKYHTTDLVFTWVNGSELTQLFKKYTTFTKEPKGFGQKRIPSIEGFLEKQRAKLVNGRDRESGELMYSLRSIQRFMQWHKGRILIVSPGHIPEWMDHNIAMICESVGHGAPLWNPKGQGPFGIYEYIRQKLDGISPRQSGGVSEHSRNRIAVVHQDSLVPWKHKTTFNTNTIEPHIYKVKHLSKVFVQFNDDYMVGRDTSVSTFINQHGGPVLLYEKNVVRGGKLSYERFRKTKSGKTWISGVFHTNGMISDLLDTTIQGSVFDVFGRYLDRSRRPSIHPKRLFIKHSPFVYCRNMQKYIAKVAADDIAEAGEVNKLRNYSDVVEPFLHHALILDAPWRASEKYHTKQLTESTVIQLNEDDSCPPAVAKVGDAAESRLMIMTDDVQDNNRKFGELMRERPTFFALNDGFSNPSIARMIREFLQKNYPFPSRYETVGQNAKALEVAKEIVDDLFRPKALAPTTEQALRHQMPLVLEVTSGDYICPVLRSVQLALPEYDGPLHFFVAETAPEGSAASESPTMDSPTGKRTGLEHSLFSQWNVPCHILPSKVTIHYAPSAGAYDAVSDTKKYELIYGSPYKNAATNPLDRVQFLTCRASDPVFGQTLALEDFIFESSAPGGSSGEAFAVGVVDVDKVNMIEAPTASGLLRTWPLPYRRYERVPWNAPGSRV